jgi:hypothetical protein
MKEPGLKFGPNWRSAFLAGGVGLLMYVALGYAFYRLLYG